MIGLRRAWARRSILRRTSSAPRSNRFALARYLPLKTWHLEKLWGECHQDDESRLLVSFGTNRRSRIVRAADNLRPRGQPALAAGVIWRSPTSSRFPNTKRIVVLTGHADKCQEEALREIKERIEAYQRAGQQITLEVRMIGLAVPAEEQSGVKQISDAVGGQAYFVSTVKELNDVLEYVLEFEPGVTQVRAVWDVVGTVGKFGRRTPAAHEQQQIPRSREDRRVWHGGLSQNEAVIRCARGQPGVAGLRALLHTGDGEPRSSGPAPSNRRHGDTRRQDGWRASESRVSEGHERLERNDDEYNANMTEMNRLSQQIVKSVRKGR